LPIDYKALTQEACSITGGRKQEWVNIRYYPEKQFQTIERLKPDPHSAAVNLRRERAETTTDSKIFPEAIDQWLRAA